MQQTVSSAFSVSGIGLHSGDQTRVTVIPSEHPTGRYFVRIDLPEKPQIPAQVSAVEQTLLSTELGIGSAKVRTVEHLLAALVASGVDHVRIEIDGPELPLLDGSAKVWVENITRVGLTSIASSELPRVTLDKPVWIQQGDAFVAALPAASTRFSYGIDFPTKAIGNQWYSWHPDTESFAEAIAPARTFALASQIASLQQAGLIKGGSLDNALVCDHQNWLNPPLRFNNEPVRHKILDLVGDLSLLGTIPRAHFLAYKASHQLHVQLAQIIKE
ncbi:UDP-3-O-acyl-N-acetylglucosamine deacetylase [Gloeocapsa sp. PCC 73106]|uniref:UDP-3-O-acyl-N-acetylglucosamine deacetylase n=1 Tax=Gloeocapsa sp. PCC 73106 TaxID=102232 RepID=UPI0002F26FA5|nr:UDP-3-O-acyl-N-acetylglucosamine deacetylase [Gloeocapsa sp. PCC 73106]